VSDWAIKVPFRDRDDPLHLGELSDMVDELIDDPLEQKVARDVLFDVVFNSDVKTYGELPRP
jgi:hypothetical protein